MGGEEEADTLPALDPHDFEVGLSRRSMSAYPGQIPHAPWHAKPGHDILIRRYNDNTYTRAHVSCMYRLYCHHAGTTTRTRGYMSPLYRCLCPATSRWCISSRGRCEAWWAFPSHCRRYGRMTCLSSTWGRTTGVRPEWGALWAESIDAWDVPPLVLQLDPLPTPRDTAA